jgi:hypothetical protein
MSEVNCPIDYPKETNEVGFANAFRVVQDSQNEWFLDFLIYSEEDQAAVTVARIRVHEEFLMLVRNRLRETLGEIPINQIPNLWFPENVDPSMKWN